MSRFTRALSVIGVAALLAAVLPSTIASSAAAVGEPGTPTRVATSNATFTTIDLTWRAPASDGGSRITDYRVKYREVGTSAWLTFRHRASTATSITVTGLKSNTTYEFQVAAVNSAGSGSPRVAIANISVGPQTTCKVLIDGSAFCWGSDQTGALGNGSAGQSSVPTAVVGLDGLTPATSAVAVTSGNVHSCALLATGGVSCWGWNQDYLLGDGTTINRDSPTPVVGIDGSTPAATAVSVSTSSLHNCAVLGNGTVKCWGWEIGDPTVVSGIDGQTPRTTAVTVSAGHIFTCAVMGDGTVKCWGKNDYGQLGDGTTTNRSTPEAVHLINGLTPATTATSVSAGYTSACAVMADGTAKCWGGNTQGQLGDSTTADRYEPVTVTGTGPTSSATRVVEVSIGEVSACAAFEDESAKCWGWNHMGQLGNGSTSASPRPASFVGADGSLSGVQGIDTNGMTACARLDHGEMTCWGENMFFGNVGDGTYENRPSPTLLKGATGTTLDISTTWRPASAPRNLALVSRAPKTLVVEWDAPVSDGGNPIGGYYVAYIRAGGVELDGGFELPADQLRMRLTDLLPGVTYRILVFSFNGAEGDPNFVHLSATVPSDAPKVRGTKATWRDRVITLTWAPLASPAPSPLVNYSIVCHAGDGPKFRTLVSRRATSAVVRVDTDQLYSCRVAGVTAEGRGLGSTRVTVGPQEGQGNGR
jgi:alpha-tubulin suppressor-like RCC1 family protein